jgi:IclR family acetate operon transcriptional repressor
MTVRQASNVLDILEYFAKTKKPATMAEVGDALGWPRSSAFNLMMTLAKRGYLCEPGTRGDFYPSPRWMALTQAIAETPLVPESLCHAAEDLAKALGETVMIASPSGTNSVYLYVAEPPVRIRYTAQVGTQQPIHATAMGRALLAQYSPSERASVLKRVPTYESYPNRWSPRNAKQVEEELKRASERGWHENVGKRSTEHTGVAVPVGLAGRRLSIGVGGLTGRMQQRIPQIAAALKRLLKQTVRSEP